MVTKETQTAAAALAEQRDLAYVVLPVEDAEPLLALTGVRDASEYEFERLVFAPGAARKIIRQALRRIDLAAGILAGIIADDATPERVANRYNRVWVSRLDARKAALEMAYEFVADDATETGHSEMGARWGSAISAVLRQVKNAELLIGAAVRNGRTFQFSDELDNELAAMRIREIEQAILSQ